MKKPQTIGKTDQWPADQIVKRQVADLTPYARNSRQHSQAQIAQIAASIKEWGWTQPIIIDEDGGILAGHGRLLAAQHLGLEEVPCVVATGWSEAKRRAYVIADNRLAETATWDMAMLATEMQDLSALDFDLELTGWDGEELARLLDGEDDAEDGDGEGIDTAPEIDRAEELRQKWGVETGQLWQLGEHRLLCGDSTKEEDVARVMGGDEWRLIVTSPPYNQKLDSFKPSGMHTETKWVKNVNSGSYFDSKPESQYQQEQILAIKAWVTASKKDASIFYNHKNRYRDKQVVSPWTWLEKTNLKVRQEIIWKREGSVTQNARMFMPCDERIFWLYINDDFYFDDSTEHKTWSSVWQINSHKDREDSLHGCAFPMELATRPISACTQANDIVFEPYLGSGTTLIACENLNRRCRAIEISPAYVAVALERWHQHTGLTPVLLP